MVLWHREDLFSIRVVLCSKVTVADLNFETQNEISDQGGTDSGGFLVP